MQSRSLHKVGAVKKQKTAVVRMKFYPIIIIIGEKIQCNRTLLLLDKRLVTVTMIIHARKKICAC